MNHKQFFFALIVLCTIINLTAMETSEKTSAQDNKDTFLIHSNNPNDLKSEGTYFSKDVLALSKTLNNMFFDDSGIISFTEKETAIAAGNKAIKNAHCILEQYERNKDKETKDEKIRKALDSYSFSDLIETSNCINILDCPQDINGIIIETIRQQLNTNSGNAGSQAFKNLNFDLKLSVMDPLKTWLRILNIQKYALERKKIVTYEHVMPVDGGSLAYYDNFIRNKAYQYSVFSLDDSSIITNKDGKIVAFDLNGQLRWTISLPVEKYITLFALHPNGTHIAYANNHQEIYIQEIYSGNKNLLGIFPAQVRDLVFNNSGSQLAIGHERKDQNSSYNNIILFDINDLKNPNSRILKGHRQAVFSLAFSPDGKMLVSGGKGNEKNLKIWDVDNGNLIKKISAQAKSVYKVLFNPQGGEIISIGEGESTGINNEPLMWNLKTDEKTQPATRFVVWDIHDLDKISSKELIGLHTRYYIRDMPIITYSPDGKTLIVGKIGSDEGNTCVICDISNPKIVYQRISNFTDRFKSLTLSKDGKKMVSSNIGYGRLGVPYVYLADWNLFTDNDEDMFKGIINYDKDAMELLYDLYNNKTVTKLESVTMLPKEMQQLLFGLPHFPKKEFIKKSLSSKFFSLKKFIPTWPTWQSILDAIKARLSGPLYH